MTQNDAISILSYIASLSNSISEEMYFSITDEKYAIISAKLNELNIQFDDMGDNTISINSGFYKDNKIVPFCNTDSYYRKYNETTDVLIILGNINTDTLVSFTDKNYTCLKYFKNGELDHNTTNFIYLKKIINILSQPEITDYKDTVIERYFILSPECGKFEIDEGGISNLIIIASEKINLYYTYKKLQTMKEYPKGWENILKNKVIRGLENISIEKNYFKELILNLSKFIDATEKDYQLFLTKRSHETIVQQFNNEKYIFADKIRTILQRISGSIVSIPLSFFGAAFAMKEIEHLPLLLIVITSLMIYIIFSAFVNILFWSDLDTVKSEMTTKMKGLSMDLTHLQKDLIQVIKPYFNRIITLKILIIISVILFGLILFFFTYQFKNIMDYFSTNISNVSNIYLYDFNLAII